MKYARLSLIASAVLALSACGKSEAPKPAADAAAPAPVAAAPAEETTVLIGSVAPLTGPIAHLGKDNESGARLAVDEINAEGLTIGGKKSAFGVGV